jgi:membrane fusion protein, multidrug efflux system
MRHENSNKPNKIKQAEMMNRTTLVLTTMCALLWYASCKPKDEEKEAPTKYLVTSPLKKDTSVTNEYVCQIKSIRHIELRAQERGYLQNIYVDEGQRVKAGQLLFRIMPKMYEAEFRTAQAEAKVTEIEYLNTKSLADSNVVSKNELAMAKAKFDKANAQLSLAQVHLEFTEIRAPFDGIIDRFNLKLGSLVGEGDLLSTLSDNSKMWVYFNVPEKEYLNYKVHVQDSNHKVKLLLANNQIYDYPGIVDVIEADFNNETGNIAFRSTFPNPKALLRHGETGNIEMQVPLKDAIIIPQKATFEIMDKKYVYIVDKNNTVELREIAIADEMPDLYVLKSGVKDGEKLLLEGIRKVKNGDKITFEYEDPIEVMAHLKLHAE